MKIHLEDSMHICLNGFHKKTEGKAIKIQFIDFKNSVNDDDIELCLSNEIMKAVQVVKLPGITIDGKMHFI